MSSLISSVPPATTILPASLGLLTSVGLAGGIYTFAYPALAPPLFGIKPLSHLTASANNTTTNGKVDSTWATLRAYIRVHGIRNLSTGIAGILLSTYYFAFPHTPAELSLIRKCMGLNLLAGAPVAVGDGLILFEYVKALKEGSTEGDRGNEKEAKEAVKLGEEKGFGHIVTGGIIAALGIALLYV